MIGYPHSPALAILDYNGDGLDDIFASLAVMDYKVGSSSGHPFSPTNTNVELIKAIFSDHVANVWAGDVDGDTDDPLRKDEIVYFYDGRLWIGGQDALGNHQHQTDGRGGGQPAISGAADAWLLVMAIPHPPSSWRPGS